MARPDAQALKWSELHPPSKAAVRDLIERLYKVKVETCRQSDAQSSCASQMPEIEVTSSFLLLGKRGSGKTTVLLSARQAFGEPGKFFKVEKIKVNDNDEAQDKDLCKDKGKKGNDDLDDLARKAGELGRFLTWIDLIDLGPLPPTANIVVHILCRIREQLAPSERVGKRVSLLASKDDDLLSRMDKLIQKAAFLWGKNVPESDRKKSRQDQENEAEYYSNFRIELQELMRQVAESRALKQSDCGVDSGGAILIAINNIDRRVEHLAELIRLIPLITGQHLWLILAASPMNLDVLLEKNIRDEFGHHGAELTSDLRSLGRRQQAVARRRAFPPGQEVEVKACTAEDALGFAISNAEERSLRKLMEAFKMERSPSLLTGPKDGKELNFYGLFDLTPYFDASALEWIHKVELDTLKKLGSENAGGGKSTDSHRLILSEAGRHALTLPLRNMVDLWMKLDRVKETTHQAAINVAFEVLEDAVDESDLDPEARERLISSLLVNDRHPDDLGFLNLTDSPLRRKFLRQPIHRFEVQTGISNEFEIEVELTRFVGCTMELLDKKSGKEGKRLATDVEGWLMLASDLVNLLPFTRSINNEPKAWNLNPRLVSTSLRGVCCNKRVDLEFYWPIPAWETYLDYEIFIRQWQAFFFWHTEGKKDIPEVAEGEQLRWLRAAYLDCILSVSEGRGGWNWIERINKRNVADYEGQVVDRLGALEKWLNGIALGGYDRTKAVARWFREELPFYSCSFLGFQRLPKHGGHSFGNEFPEYARRSWLAEVQEHCMDLKADGSMDCTLDELIEVLTAKGGDHEPG